MALIAVEIVYGYWLNYCGFFRNNFCDGLAISGYNNLML